jgi:hypothetical protein
MVVLSLLFHIENLMVILHWLDLEIVILVEGIVWIVWIFLLGENLESFNNLNFLLWLDDDGASALFHSWKRRFWCTSNVIIVFVFGNGFGLAGASGWSLWWGLFFFVSLFFFPFYICSFLMPWIVLGIMLVQQLSIICTFSIIINSLCWLFFETCTRKKRLLT